MMAQKKVKDMTTEELLAREKKLRRKDKEACEERIDTMRGWINDEREENQKLKEAKKGYTIRITEQTWTITSLHDAQKKVKELMDVGIWWTNLGQVK